MEQKSETGNAAKFSNESPTKNTSAIESIHPEFQRSTPATRKTDTSETEFQFIPNDDPLTPKTKLCSSPKIGESSSFAQNAFEDTFPSLEANSTINAVTNADMYQCFACVVHLLKFTDGRKHF